MTPQRATLFCRNRGDLLLRREQARLRAPTVDVADDPAPAAVSWVQSQTSLTDADIEVVRTGPQVRADGEPSVPVLLDTERRPGVQQHDWVAPPTLLTDKTVSWLWPAYDAVRPSVETIAADTAHGAATLSLRALAHLRDEAIVAARREATHEGETVADRLRATARAVRDARPSMAVVRNRVNRLVSSVDCAVPAAVADRAQEEIDRAVGADRGAASTVADHVDGARVATLSRSGTVRTALETGTPEAVLVAESRPGAEGVRVAESLTGNTNVTLTTDAAFPAQLSAWEADSLLVGADTIGPDGRVRNKVGTFPAATVAARLDVPVLVAAATDKVSHEMSAGSEPWPAPLYTGETDLSTTNPTFDITPAECVTAVMSEQGVLEPGDVPSIAAEHERRAAWDVTCDES